MGLLSVILLSYSRHWFVSGVIILYGTKNGHQLKTMILKFYLTIIKTPFHTGFLLSFASLGICNQGNISEMNWLLSVKDMEL